ncbi:MAG: inositol phosphorylceramide synthase [Chloroflexi bacterium]|nr:MAG: inositol phosphorylceramide synthase [Chloroflexota bacterium]TMD54047.1 MAG: inositol phosphorylceramide synthase [Chloroflexota bacterium]
MSSPKTELRPPAGGPRGPRPPAGGHRWLWLGIALYLGLIFGVMLWRGISIEPQWVVLALLLVAVALGRGRAFLVDWLPFLVLFFAYEIMRGFASKTGFAPHDVSPLERAVFGGSLPTVILQHRFYNPALIGIQDWVSMIFYFLHFPLPIVVGFVFWINDRAHYWRFISALLLMSFLSFVTYLFFPTDPPWIANSGEVHKVINETVQKWGVDYLVSPFYSNLNPNKFAAFPSLHAAFPALSAIYAWRRYRWLAIGLLAYTACVWIAIVYLGEHYFVDALAGLAYAFAATAIVTLVAVRRARRVS